VQVATRAGWDRQCLARQHPSANIHPIHLASGFSINGSVVILLGTLMMATLCASEGAPTAGSFCSQ
jgi:hypothetical protein